MLKVVQINAVDSTASTGTVMRDIQDVCLHSGIDCHIAYCETQRSKADIYQGYKIGNRLDFRIHQVLSHLTRKQGYYSTLPTKRFLRYLDRIQPDIVHLHNLHQNYINLNMLLDYLAKKDIATVITLHDNWLYSGECCLYENHKCDHWQRGCKECPLNRQGVNRFLPNNTEAVFGDRERYFNAIPRLSVVGVSEWMSSEAAKGLFKERHILTIRNGVRTDVFAPLNTTGRQQVRAQWGIRDDQFVILAPASKWLEPVNIKGFETLTASLKDDELLFLYGCNQTQMNGTHPDKVRLIPFTPHKALLSTYYSMADLFVNCTRMDTCSFINIEAQACGTPVVTFDNTGAAETVDGECGQRVKTGDFQAMVNAIAEARSRKDNAQKCRDWVEKRFSMRGNYEEYVRLYEKIAEHLQ